MLLLLTLLLSCVAVCAQPVLSLNDPTVVAKSSSLLQGLVGYWQLEESSGTRYDRSPYGNHLTANNSPTNAAGVQGSALNIVQASSQYVSRSAATLSNFPSGLTAFTFAGWGKLNTTGGAYVRGFGGKYDYGNNNRSFSIVGINSTDTRFFVSYDGTNVATSTNTATISTNVWYFYCGVYDLTNVSLYINAGTPSKTAFTNTVYNSSAPFTLGCRFNNGAPPSSGDFWDGLIDEVGVWNRALSTNEITKLYRSGLGVTYPRFSMRDNRADDFNWDTWEPLYDRPKPFPTLMAFVNRREPEPLLTICE